jgi:hypothetical protein
MVEHLQVFGCATYVFIPAEVCENKLAPKSELMTYLGNHPRGKGWIFMCGPNNVIFSAAQATFDESLYLKCPKASVRPYTRLQTPAPTTPHPCHCDDGNCRVPHNEDDDQGGTGPETDIHKEKGKERARDANPEEASVPAPRLPSPTPVGTGGKGWCPDPVHHKYIARKWTKDLANTHPEYFKDIQNFPSQFN